MNDWTDREARIRQIVREELTPIRESQDMLLRQQAHLLKELGRELDDTQRALAYTRGALKGHAEGMGRQLSRLFHPLVKAAVFAATIILVARYGLPF